MVRRTEGASSSIEVQVARLGERVDSYLMAEGSTVGDVLDKAGIDRSTNVKVNGEVVDMTDIVENNDRLFIAGKVSGGC